MVTHLCKHPILTAFVSFSFFTTFARKLIFVHNETNVFRGCCTPVDMRQGILRLSQLLRSNDFNSSDAIVYVFYYRSVTESSCFTGSAVVLSSITS